MDVALALSASFFFTTIVFVLLFDPPSYTVFIDTPSNFCFLECNTWTMECLDWDLSTSLFQDGTSLQPLKSHQNNPF
jgi:hypothetical protein